MVVEDHHVVQLECVSAHNGNYEHNFMLHVCPLKNIFSSLLEEELLESPMSDKTILPIKAMGHKKKNL
jgi:hypothetical protein